MSKLPSISDEMRELSELRSSSSPLPKPVQIIRTFGPPNSALHLPRLRMTKEEHQMIERQRMEQCMRDEETFWNIRNRNRP